MRTDAHLASAAWVARQPERFAALRKRHRPHFFVPDDELLKAVTVKWCIPVAARQPAVVSSLAGRLRPELLQEVVEGLFKKLWRKATPFERLWPQRARGFAAVPADRLVVASRLKRLTSTTDRFAARVPANLPACFAVPARECFTPHRSCPWVEVLGLPILLLGGAEDVDTALVLASAAHHDDLPLQAWERFFGERGVAFFAGEARHFFFTGLAEELIEQIKRELCLERARHSRARRSRLRHVK